MNPAHGRRRFLITAAGAAVAGCSSQAATSAPGPDGGLPGPGNDAAAPESDATVTDGSVQGTDPPDVHVPPPDAQPDAGSPCATPVDSDGGDAGKNSCALAALELRVPGGALLGVGKIIFMAPDTSSAVILARDDEGIYALSGQCTHQCSTVAVCADATCATRIRSPQGACLTVSADLLPTGAAFRCPNHGSQFSAGGGVVMGPAQRPLPALAVRLDGDDALIDLRSIVDAGVRVVPEANPSDAGDLDAHATD